MKTEQSSCYIIAEAGVNHNGDVNIAIKLIAAAKQAGADAIKFQTFQAEDLVTPDAPKATYQAEQTGSDETQFEMLQKLELDQATHHQLMAECERQGIEFLSTPFDLESARFLVEAGMSRIKIPSGELTNLPFIKSLAAMGPPLIVSTGMATLTEVEAAVAAIRSVAPDRPVTLLQCTSNYPAAPADANLRAMVTMREACNTPVGYSDHVPDNTVAFAAVALGAQLVEKHLTLDCDMEGPDHAASIEPESFEALVRGIRTVESALGSGIKEPAASEHNTATVARRSIVAARQLSAGTVLAEEDLAFRRPGTGLPPSAIQQVLGRTLLRDLPPKTLLAESDLK